MGAWGIFTVARGMPGARTYPCDLHMLERTAPRDKAQSSVLAPIRNHLPQAQFTAAILHTPIHDPCTQMHIHRSVTSRFFNIIFFRFIKNICGYIFLQICHSAAGSFGGKELPPDEPAVSSLAHSPSNIPPFHPAVATYHRATARL